MAKTAAVTIALAILAVLSAGSISPAAVTVAAEGDAWVTSRFPTRNFGAEAVMRVNDTPLKRGFVRFQVAEAGIRRATLRLFAETASSSSLEVHATSAAWSETGLTHANAPAADALVATVPTAQAGTWLEIDVTSAVAGPGPVSFLLTMPSAADELVLSTREGGRAPQLVLEVGDPPAALAPPTIAGTLRAGQTLTASHGTWTGNEPIAFSLQWLRCGPAGGGCVDIPDASAPTYLLGQADVGRTIRVRETGTNGVGSSSATSNATAQVAAAIEPPASVAPPAVSGTALLGRTLTAVPGSWTGSPPLALSVQWQRCNASGVGCADVPGATTASYLVGPDDLGLTLRVRETATNVAGSSSAVSAATAVVVDPGNPPAPLTLPTIAGTPRVGETLSAGPGTWTGTGPIAFSFQWQRCGPIGGGCTDLPGATGTTYLLGPEDFERTIRVREIGTNLAGSASSTSDATAQIAQAILPPAPLVPPEVTGAPLLGRTLTVVPGTWTGTPPLALAYAWQRCTPTCVDVPEAVATTYTVGPDDLGTTIRVRETATNEVGSSSAVSAATGVVVDPGDPPLPLTPPAVTGTARVGQALGVTPASWSGAQPMATSFQWLRCGPVGGGCEPIESATGATYLLGEIDVDDTIRVRETATNLAGTASSDSDATSVVLGIPVPPPPPPPSGDCSRADATGCTAVAGSRVSLLNQKFTCNRPLADIAVQNPIGTGPGHLPLLVEVGFTTYVELNPAVIDLRQDCIGDGDDETIDLILAVAGNGRTVGGTADAIKVRLTAREIQVTGYANCGPRGSGADGLPNTPDDEHQDGAQIQGGDTVEFIDFEWGDWETSSATCQGAAGTFLPGSVNSNLVKDMACIRCKSVSCNHGMHLGVSVGSLVVDSMWRSGNPADRAGVIATGQLGLCDFGSPPCSFGVRPDGAQEAVGYTILRNFCDHWPYEDPPTD